ncbi:MAG: aminotransferase class III-fold pyridoxal phosphate-dependent enzyme, partial [Bacteroidetes bacterium]|nr:aminotransferase class III-fold pyridoxal phosphate-dependent enzyme [Bacteroidota bacterium]
GGVLISPDFKPKYGMLGTTFGGAYLACAAGIAVLDVIKQEQLMENATAMGRYLVESLQGIEGIKEIRSLGLMTGIELNFAADSIRKKLLLKHHMFTGSASNKNTLRILPSLTVSKIEIDLFVNALQSSIKEYYNEAVSIGA